MSVSAERRGTPDSMANATTLRIDRLFAKSRFLGVLVSSALLAACQITAQPVSTPESSAKQEPTTKVTTTQEDINEANRIERLSVALVEKHVNPDLIKKYGPVRALEIDPEHIAVVRRVGSAGKNRSEGYFFQSLASVGENQGVGFVVQHDFNQFEVDHPKSLRASQFWGKDVIPEFASLGVEKHSSSRYPGMFYASIPRENFTKVAETVFDVPANIQWTDEEAQRLHGNFITKEGIQAEVVVDDREVELNFEYPVFSEEDEHSH